MQTIISYNEREVRHDGSHDDVNHGYNVWVDLVDPSPSEMQDIERSFHLDAKAVETIKNKSKKPQVRILDKHKFTIALDMKFKDAATLKTEPIYMFLGRGWLITIHAKTIDLQSKVLALEEKNHPILASSIDALYYNILSAFVESYEQLLTAIELSITEYEQRSLYRPTRKMLEHLDSLARQIIILRRHFWHMRDIINFLMHLEEDKQDVKYLKIVYDDINQLIELTESYRETVNSTRELYIANVSLQMNDTVKTLTIFSAILLPLTFITGLFGMNGLDLNNISKLPAGFALIVMAMGMISATLFVFFKKKEWIMAKEAEIMHHRFEESEQKKNPDNEDASKEMAEKTRDKIVDSEAG